MSDFQRFAYLRSDNAFSATVVKKTYNFIIGGSFKTTFTVFSRKYKTNIMLKTSQEGGRTLKRRRIKCFKFVLNNKIN